MRFSAELLADELAEIVFIVAGSQDGTDKKPPSSRALDPAAFNSRVKELRRGGLSAQSMSDGRKGAETPVPGRDKFEALLGEASTEYAKCIDNAVRALRRAKQRQDFILEVRKPSPEPTMCSNPACANLLPADRDSGECGSCRAHRSKHGLAWPYEQAVAK